MLDLITREIVGYAISTTPDAQLAKVIKVKSKTSSNETAFMWGADLSRQSKPLLLGFSLKGLTY